MTPTRPSLAPNSSIRPVADALCHVLESRGRRVAKGASESDGLVRVLSYGRNTDFDYCWSLGAGGVTDWIRTVGTAIGAPARIILVNDGLPLFHTRPAGTVSDFFDAPDVLSYVTAYDWIVAVLSSLSAGGNPPVHLQLHLFDPWASGGDDEPFGRRTLRVVAPEIPGLHLYQITSRDEDLAEHLIEDESAVVQRVLRLPGGARRLLANLGISGKETATTATIGPEQQATWLVDLRMRWSNRLTAPVRRHSVSNLVAPLILARGMNVLGGRVELPDHPYAHLVGALESLLEALGLVPIVSKTSSGASPPKWWMAADPMVTADGFDRFKELSVLLVDDHAGRGYAALVREALAGPTKVMPKGWFLQADTSPCELIAHLEHLLGLTNPTPGDETCPHCGGHLRTQETIVPHSPRMLGHPGGAIGSPQPGEAFAFDVLVFDLRLFEAGGQDIHERRDAERKHVQQLLDIYHVIGCRTEDEGLRTNLHYAATSAKRRLDELDLPPGRADVDASERVDHLALFPLLLSEIDRSVPIVLFSSTRQRRLLELLDSAPNIITTFAKPAMTGAAPEMSPEDAALSLLASLRSALRLHESRCIWKRLLDLNWATNMPSIETWDRTTPRGQAVYAKSVYAWKPGERPRPDGEKLRELLAEIYVHYFGGGLFFDFLSIPWELIEGALTPESLLTDPNVSGTGFAFPTVARWRATEPRSQAALAIELIRHRKAHGHERPSGAFHDADDYRIGAIILFLFLLDFIEGATCKAEPVQIQVADFSGFLVSRHPHLPRGCEPRNLTADESVPWTDVIAYTFLIALNRAVQGDRRAISEATVCAVERLCGRLVIAFWTQVESTLPPGKEVHGDVVDVIVRSWDSSAVVGYSLDINAPCRAWLDYRNAARAHSLGERVLVSIIRTDRGRGSIVVRERAVGGRWQPRTGAQ